MVPYVGYGADGWVRVLARVLLAPPGSRRREVEDGRGWRRFFCASAADVPVTIQLGEQTHVVTSVRDGYVDVRLESDLEPGWNTARLSAHDADPVDLPVRVVAPGPQLGLVSDIDDTVVVTMLPRPVGKKRAGDPIATLTDRERRVLALMAQGMSNSALSTELSLSAKTIEAHVRSIFTKLNLVPDAGDHRRVRAVLAFLRNAP